MKAIVSEKGQVTIPKEIRERLGLLKGHVLEFNEENGRLVAVKVLAGSPVEKVYGLFQDGRETDAVMEELRGKPGLP